MRAPLAQPRTSAAASSRRLRAGEELLDQRRRLLLGERRVLRPGPAAPPTRPAAAANTAMSPSFMRASCGRKRERQLLRGLRQADGAEARVARLQPGRDLVQVGGARRFARAARRSARRAPTPPARAAGRCAARRTAPGSRRRRRALLRACCAAPPPRRARGRPAPAGWRRALSIVLRHLRDRARGPPASAFCTSSSRSMIFSSACASPALRSSRAEISTPFTLASTSCVRRLGSRGALAARQGREQREDREQAGSAHQ